ncbi:DUF4198 domain-containing protein [Hymenobacter setariae]|uniref:DUF4198 domain-containing protein n=1 Tax=Hymenobacter setariae TaxID=2594794 RepID=A0A558C424_9BACT|nr:DUF4198 domain-containing protein [Hymenobacter setariae]TVT43510.1 DUF4198 domain-containing protein [Hymenobacter setariae]
MTRGSRPIKLLSLSLLFASSVALANEFWLQPASFRVAVGTPVPLRLLLGENLTGRPWPRPARRTQRFVHLGPTGSADSTNLRPALLADSVAPSLTLRTPGTHVAALTSTLAFSELPADKFTAYLRAEGFDKALLYRQQQGQTTTKPGREAYRRCAKALMLATASARAPRSPADTAYRHSLNLPLELVPEQNPYYLRLGASLTLRVLRQGQPVPGALVRVWDASPPAPDKSRANTAIETRYFSTRANNNGRVLLRLPGGGPYLVVAKYLEPAPAALKGQTDWLSTWATLTFGGPGAPTDGPTTLFRK